MRLSTWCRATITEPRTVGFCMLTLANYVERLAALQAEARLDKMGTLDYLIGIALIEAERQVAHPLGDRVKGKSNPADVRKL